MSKLIHEAGEVAPGIIKGPPDAYWDSYITRREVQMAVNDLCINEQALQNRSDTANIVLNYVVEKLNITRGELDAFVERKKTEAAALQAKIAAEKEVSDERSKG